MRSLLLNSPLTDAQTNLLKGQPLSWRHYDALFAEDIAVRGPDGSLAAVLVTGAIPPSIIDQAFPLLQTVDGSLSNRSSVVGVGSQMSRTRKSDGLPSPRKTVPKEVLIAHGGVGDQIGFMDERGSKICRLTNWTAKNPGILASCSALIQRVDSIYRKVTPAAYARQLAKVQQIPSDLRLFDTNFTTVTVNKNNRTRAHKDSGDVRDGLGCLCTFGEYQGGHFIMPKFKIAFDLKPGDLLLANVHEMHGNSEMSGERISCVFYARERMHLCPEVAA